MIFAIRTKLPDLWPPLSEGQGGGKIGNAGKMKNTQGRSYFLSFGSNALD
jgi:hypothetical protein